MRGSGWSSILAVRDFVRISGVMSARRQRLDAQFRVERGSDFAIAAGKRFQAAKLPAELIRFVLALLADLVDREGCSDFVEEARPG